jgi:hypothetical protein
MPIDRNARACLLAALMIVAPSLCARAQSAADVFHEAESKYMFGFIDGSDIGNEGEKAFEYEATGSFQKRGGRYTAIEHEFAFEYVPTQNFAFELSAHALTHAISGVDDLDDRNSTQFSGASAKLRYLILGRGPGSPVGLTISAEPEWSRVDGTYDGLLFQTFQGHALFAGPTLQINVSRKMLLAAAFMAQAAGHAVDDPRPLDLTNFERYRANLKLEFEF